MYLGRNLDLFGSYDVIGHVTIWFPIHDFLQVLHWNWRSISNGFWDIETQMNWGHDLDFSGSRDVIGDVTMGLPLCDFLMPNGSRHWPFWVMWCHQSRDHLIPYIWFPINAPLELRSISNRFRDIEAQMYWGHDLELSGSRDVMGDVTIRLPICDFL